MKNKSSFIKQYKNMFSNEFRDYYVSKLIKDSLFFANSDELIKAIETQANDFKNYIFSMCGVTYLDVPAVESLRELIEKLKKENKDFCFTGVSDSVYLNMKHTRFVELVGEDHFYSSVDKVLLNCNGECL